MDNHLLLAFISTAFLLTVTPGVDTAIVLRAATVDGRRQALMASLGIALGCLIWGAAVSLGLGALLRASEVAYTLVKFAGALYLVWLGARLLLKPRATLESAAGEVYSRSGDAFWRGFLTNLLNPKVGVVLCHLPAAVRARRGWRCKLFLFSRLPAYRVDARLVRCADRGHGPPRSISAAAIGGEGAGSADRRHLRRLWHQARCVTRALRLPRQFASLLGLRCRAKAKRATGSVEKPFGRCLPMD